MNKSRTAGILIIGNEILSAKVRDGNSFFLAGELRALGVEVRRILVIPDETDIIGKETREFSEHFDYVFTSGGVGPTHDDVTMEGIASGFNVSLVMNRSMEEILRSRYRENLNKAVLKMAMLPEGANIIFSEEMRFPIVCFRNIYIFPGIPEYLKNKFALIRERFRCSHFYLRRLFVNARESDIAEILNEIALQDDSVLFGSYPVLDGPGYGIIITAEAKSEELLTRAVDHLTSKLPPDVLVKME